jgi:hypothetical protein
MEQTKSRMDPLQHAIGVQKMITLIQSLLPSKAHTIQVKIAIQLKMTTKQQSKIVYPFVLLLMPPVSKATNESLSLWSYLQIQYH